MKHFVDAGLIDKRCGNGVKLLAKLERVRHRGRSDNRRAKTRDGCARRTGRGDGVTARVVVEVSRVSRAARAAIEANGGRVTKVHYNRLGLERCLSRTSSPDRRRHRRSRFRTGEGPVRRRAARWRRRGSGRCAKKSIYIHIYIIVCRTGYHSLSGLRGGGGVAAPDHLPLNASMRRTPFCPPGVVPDAWSRRRRARGGARRLGVERLASTADSMPSDELLPDVPLTAMCAPHSAAGSSSGGALGVDAAAYPSSSPRRRGGSARRRSLAAAAREARQHGDAADAHALQNDGRGAVRGGCVSPSGTRAREPRRQRYPKPGPGRARSFDRRRGYGSKRAAAASGGHAEHHRGAEHGERRRVERGGREDVREEKLSLVREHRRVGVPRA